MAHKPNSEPSYVVAFLLWMQVFGVCAASFYCFCYYRFMHII